MREDRKQTGAWVALFLLGALIFYPLSAGPVVWVVARCGFLEWQLKAFEAIYQPLELLHDHGPPVVSRPIDAYVEWWLNDYFGPVPRFRTR